MLKKTSIDMVYTVNMVYTVGWDGWVAPLLDCYELENIAHDWRRVFIKFMSQDGTDGRIIPLRQL